MRKSCPPPMVTEPIWKCSLKFFPRGVAGPHPPVSLRQQVRYDNADEFTRGYHLRVFPELRKVPRISGYQVICAGCICTFEENIVVRITCHTKPIFRGNELRMIA